MAIYKLTTTLTISCFTEVEADTEEDAKSIATERSLMDAPHNLESMGDPQEQWVVAELDGEPNIDTIKVDSVEEE